MVPPSTVFGRLWRRAPWWRGLLMSAMLLSLLFVLYRPIPSPPTDAGVQLGALAHYVRPAATAGGVAAVGLPDTAPAPAASRPAAKPAAVSVARPVSTTPKTAALSLAGPSSAQDSLGIDHALAGRLYSDFVAINGYKVPLPAGKWVQLANTSINIPSATGSGFFLGKIEHKRLVGAVSGMVLRSKDKPGAGYPEVTGCARPDPTRNFALVEEVVAFDNQSCWRIHSYYTPPLQKWADRSVNIGVLDRAAAGAMAAKGIDYPQDLVDVRMSRFTKGAGMEVHYMFNPEVEGISSSTVVSYTDMDWRANNIVRYPEKQAYVEKLKAWGAQFWPKFKAAFSDDESALDAR